MIKLYIRENNEFLSEDIAAVKKYYPNIDDDTFDMLIKLDPTYRGNQSLGKYGKWILNLFNKNKLSNEDIDNITDVLNQFTTYRNRIANKDLNSYKSVADLEDTLANVVDDDSMLTDRQKVRFLKNVKSGKVKTSANDDYDIVLDTPNFIVYVPNTHEASMKLGKGTEWCTAHENPDWYNSYTKGNYKLYIIRNKKTGKRWQYSDFRGDFLDDRDKKFDIPELMRQDKELSKFFKKFLGIDYFAFDGTWVYDGNKVPKELKDVITKVIVDKTVDHIDDNAFDGCYNMKSIQIPDSVTTIASFAFASCESLTSIELPDNLVRLGGNDFVSCKSLTSVRIPDNIKYLPRYLFAECSNLETVIMSDSIKLIDEFAFAHCNNLASIKIPESVVEITECAFLGCESLTSIKIPEGVKTIDHYTFARCTNLTSIQIPNSITRIGKNAFESCINLKKIIIPDSVTQIRRDAFKNCDNLTIYTNNEYVINYCDENDIPVKPLNANESYRNNYRKLHLR